MRSLFPPRSGTGMTLEELLAGQIGRQPVAAREGQPGIAPPAYSPFGGGGLGDVPSGGARLPGVSSDSGGLAGLRIEAERYADDVAPRRTKDWGSAVKAYVLNALGKGVDGHGVSGPSTGPVWGSAPMGIRLAAHQPSGAGGGGIEKEMQALASRARSPRGLRTPSAEDDRRGIQFLLGNQPDGSPMGSERLPPASPRSLYEGHPWLEDPTSFSQPSNEPSAEDPAVAAREQVKRRIRAIESKGDDMAYNRATGASGRYQFRRPTWVSLHNKVYGDPGLSYKFSVPKQERLMNVLMNENGSILRKKGFEVTPRNLYILHFLGASNGLRVLRNPKSATKDVLPERVIRDNENLLRDKTTAQVLAWAEESMKEP
jgi:hypothetical protein